MDRLINMCSDLRKRRSKRSCKINRHTGLVPVKGSVIYGMVTVRTRSPCVVAGLTLGHRHCALRRPSRSVFVTVRFAGRHAASSELCVAPGATFGDAAPSVRSATIMRNVALRNRNP